MSVFDEEFPNAKLELISVSAKSLDLNSIPSATQLHTLLKLHDKNLQVNISNNIKQKLVTTNNTFAAHSNNILLTCHSLSKFEPKIPALF